ncbi:hypothetical protein AB1Y20_011366 [Prymnesium parvum]|uniref:Response regulatory domain-containing protein n=1 Tax=Prymnesium parvum TaxID=97485 RepID=A0AB34INN7_PRYPA
MTTPSSTVVIDDEPMITMIMGSTLSARVPSMRVTELGNVPEERESLECVCDLALKADPQLIVCDNYLDKLSGIDVARALQERGYKGVFFLHTCCTEEEKTELQKEHILTIDAIIQKGLRASEEVLTEYARMVTMSRCICSGRPTLHADVERIRALDTGGNTSQLAGEASWLAKVHEGDCRLTAIASRIRGNATAEGLAHALVLAINQVRFLAEQESPE